MPDFGTANAGILAQTYLQKQELRQDALLRGGALMLSAYDTVKKNKREDSKETREQEIHDANYGEREVTDADGNTIKINPAADKAVQTALQSRVLTKRMQKAGSIKTAVALLEDASSDPDAGARQVGGDAELNVDDIPNDAPHMGQGLVDPNEGNRENPIPGMVMDVARMFARPSARQITRPSLYPRQDDYRMY